MNAAPDTCGASAEAGSREEEQTPLGDLRIYTNAQMLVGWSDSHGRRLSDFLNETGTGFLTLFQASAYDLLGDGEAQGRAERATLRKAAVHLAVPNDSLQVFRPRVSTELVPIELSTSFFRVRGDLHRSPTDPSNLEQFLSGHSRRFLAVSNAKVEYRPNPRFDSEQATVLISTDHVDCWWIELDPGD